MAVFIKKGRKYYTTKKEALNARRRGDRIYYGAQLGAYYVVRPKRKKLFWVW